MLYPVSGGRTDVEEEEENGLSDNEEEAMENVLETLPTKPSFILKWLRSQRLDVGRKDIENTIRHYNECIRIRPEKKEPYFFLGLLHLIKLLFPNNKFEIFKFFTK